MTRTIVPRYRLSFPNANDLYYTTDNSSDTVGSVGGPNKVLPGVSVNNERMSRGCLNGYRREILERPGIRPAYIQNANSVPYSAGRRLTLSQKNKS